MDLDIQCFPQCFISAIVCRNGGPKGGGQHLCLSESINRRLRLFPYFVSAFSTIAKGSIKSLLKKAALLPLLNFREVDATTDSTMTTAVVAFICQLIRDCNFVTMRFNIYNANALYKIKPKTFCWLFFLNSLQII